MKCGQTRRRTLTGVCRRSAAASFSKSSRAIAASTSLADLGQPLPARLDRVATNQIDAERRPRRRADLANLQGEGGAGERLAHRPVAGDLAQPSALFAAGAGGIFVRGLGEGNLPGENFRRGAAGPAGSTPPGCHWLRQCRVGATGFASAVRGRPIDGAALAEPVPPSWRRRMWLTTTGCRRTRGDAP